MIIFICFREKNIFEKKYYYRIYTSTVLKKASKNVRYKTYRIGSKLDNDI